MDEWAWDDCRNTVNVVKTESGTELRVDGKVVEKLGKVSFQEARSAAYKYIWDRPGKMWSIIGAVE